MKTLAKLIGLFTLISLLAACGGGGNGASFTGGGSGLPGGGTGAGTGVTSVPLGSLTATSTSPFLTANGTSFTKIRGTVQNVNKAAAPGVAVNFTTTAGTLSAASATTDANGIAEVTLTSTTKVATANVTVSTSGFNQSVSVPFVAGSAVASNSSLSGSPSSLPADGISTSTVTALLVDANNNLVADGTSVLLTSSTGTITSTNPSATNQGRATFTLRAPTTTSTATLGVASVTGLTGSVVFGSASTGDPANILLNVGSSQVAVAGVGQASNTSITIQVNDSVGNPIKETSYNDTTKNNVRVSILSQPNGGEYISGTNAAGSVVTTTSGPILVRTLNGSITLNFQSGTLPGIVEVKVEALLGAAGSSLATPVTAIAPQISIASGPVSSIVLSYPITNSIENLGGGFYRRIGKAAVTDRYGNAVPDGTAINFGILDSVIAMGADGATSAASPTLASAVNFSTASITRNGTTRFIQGNDRILLENTPVTDKSRFVSISVPPASGSLTAQANYLATTSSLNFVVGAAMIGTDIFGVQADGVTLTKGSGVTKDGIATFKISYPANVNTIQTGCYGYSSTSPATYSALDTRWSPVRSGQVYVVASTNSNSASTVNRGTFCLASISGWTLTAQPTAVSSNSVSTFSAPTTNNVTLKLVDGGDKIRLPFEAVTYSVNFTTNKGGLNVSVSEAGIPGETGKTLADGTLVSTISSYGGVSGDTAVVSYFAGDAVTTVTVKVP